MIRNLNPTSQAMMIFQSQAFQKNIFDKIMGGIVATLIDCSTSIALISSKPKPTVSASIFLNCQYYRGISIGERAFVLCELKNISPMDEKVRNNLQRYQNQSRESLGDFSLDKDSQMMFRGYDNEIEICQCEIYDEKGRLCYVGSHAKIPPNGKSSPVNKRLKKAFGNWTISKFEGLGERYPDVEEILKMREKLHKAYGEVVKRPLL